MSNKITNHFKSRKRKRAENLNTEKVDTVEILSDDESANNASEQDPKEIYKDS